MKASGSVASLLQGVSQQAPKDRAPGQHTEQVNMLPDPVHGLSRRHGSRWVAERATGLDVAHLDSYIADTETFRTFEYNNNGHDYVLLVRRGARPVGSDLPLIHVYDRTAGAFLPVVRPIVDANSDLLEAGGVSAMTSIGRFVYMAGNTTPTSASTATPWADAANQQEAVVWIRGGAYARTYSVTTTDIADVVRTFTYKTPAASYPGTLDTSGVPVYAADSAGGTSTDTESAYITSVGGVPTAKLSWSAWSPTVFSMKKGASAMTNVTPASPTTNLEYKWVAGAATVQLHSSNLGAIDVTMTYTHTKTITNPNYAKTVTDLSNAFNSAVTNWIGTAAEAIQPENIAEQLRLAAVAAGHAGATRQASTIIFSDVKSVIVSDGADNSFIRGVANEVTSIDEVSDIHKVGKVIKVRAKGSNEAFYLRAEARDSRVTSGYTEVTWVEGAGVIVTITAGLLFGTVSNGTFWFASTAQMLAHPTMANITVPDYKVSTVGDLDTSPIPFFVGKTITYLGVFQDRLLIGAGAVLRCSKIGDYLNFFRSSVLTAPADDPLEMLSQGADDDVLRHSVMYDRDLVLFADKRQYAVSGRIALSPTSANMQVMSQHSGTAAVPPLAVGGIIFYGTLGERASSVHQIQPGSITESPESYPASSQIDTYLLGDLIEFCHNAKPLHIFARTTGKPNSVFVFSYLDKNGQGRVQDAWHRFDFHTDLGTVMGMSRTPDGLLVYFLRTAVDYNGNPQVYVVADLVVLTAGLSSYPYLDSQRDVAEVLANDSSVHEGSAGAWQVAFDDTSEWRFVGDTLAMYPSLAAEFPLATGPVAGCTQVASFAPTNPFVRDRNDKAITTGVLTVTKVVVSIEESSGWVASIEARGATTSQQYTARVVGAADNLVGREPVVDFSESVIVGLETREYTLTLSGIKWLPFTLTSLEWVGQWFNRVQRI